MYRCKLLSISYFEVGILESFSPFLLPKDHFGQNLEIDKPRIDMPRGNQKQPLQHQISTTLQTYQVPHCNSGETTTTHGTEASLSKEILAKHLSDTGGTDLMVS